MNDEQTRSIATPNANQRPASPLAELIAELWRYKFVVPAVAALVTASVAFWTLRQTKIYEAAATLEYDPNPSRPLGTAVEDPVAAQVSDWDLQEYYETQNFILRSRSLAERVARTLRLHQDKDFMEADREEAQLPATVEVAAAKLMRAMTANQVRDTRIVRIMVRDHNPERAQRIANTWVDEFLDKSLEDRLGSSTRAMQWLSDQMQSLKNDVESSELALYRYREQHHSLSASLGERQRVIANQLESYSSTLTSIHSKRIQTEARLSVLKELLSGTLEQRAIDANVIAGDHELATLRQHYGEAVDELSKLTVTYGDAHPQVRAARGSVESLEMSIAGKLRSIVRGAEVELQEYERAERGIQNAINEVNHKGLALSLEEIDYARLDRERSSKSKLYELVMQRAAQTDLTRALRVANGRVVDPAARPTIVVSPRVRLNIALGAIVGIALGIAAALGVSVLDNKVRGPADIESRGVTVLGVLPAVGSTGDTQRSRGSRSRKKRVRRVESQERDLIVHIDPRSNSAECCRTIRTNITFQSADRPLRAIAITSAMPRDGKSVVSLNIAAVIAQSGRRVLIVDTDLRKPRLHRAFKLPSGPGVTSFLAGETTFDDALQPTEVPNVTLLQCGPIPPNPSELLHTKRFTELIELAKARFDTIIFDTPPLGAVTDPAVISTQVDGTILVVRSGTTTRAGVDAALRQLTSVSARIIGVVLNAVDLSDSNYGSYYAYYRGYYADDGAPDGPAAHSAGSA